MAGIYIHVPFCTQRCSYCDFFSTIRLEEMDSYTDSVCLEIIQRKDYIKDKHINTIYFGGGTPSLLSKENTDNLISAPMAGFTNSPLRKMFAENGAYRIFSEMVHVREILNLNLWEIPIFLENYNYTIRFKVGREIV